MNGNRIVAGVLVASLTLTGCGVAGLPDMHSIPLPGGAELGEHPYRVTVHFADALNLVPQASVRVNDVAVGKVESIRLSEDNATAVVTVLVNGDTRLPANATARLRQSSLLGAKFVELGAPAKAPARGRLSDGAVIPLERTGRNPEIEEVLGALSMLLNGGGIAQLGTITEELNAALSGNEPQLRSLLANLDETVSRLDSQKDDITRAIDGMNRLSSTLRSQTGNITTALEELGPGIEVINRQRDRLVTMLQSLDRLSAVTVDTINKSQKDLIADLRALEPTLRKLAETGEALPKAIGYLATYPFPEYAMKPLKGDYVNTDVRLDLDLSNILEQMVDSEPLLPLPLRNRVQQGKDASSPAVPPQDSEGAPEAAPGSPEPPAQDGPPAVLDNILGGSR
ncbi:phospholipid/cholesterol/gamma-HCH transport system substrate-binding protein [Halopolyspora algeriensis]|uniref:Phospholipid/cholesterol/gamma-HCH transport system substrate-binding protein n=1 Tax=Halopolyspora algeriensis TaxID=1500506 RepID=A0A368VWI2_9ACTN|nr:MCE family protein [Halopolyspora algeriensis]RCW44527.1 phospholipid/cholesterol/gamma-HCH transport system substrate-binding protein [Halopolyspora algeriensis]TQM55887.1 phospholipid/cholesterol/gamma-HCH transport system substrate-binding protein [Halopolyspora algeriensis]